MQEILQRVDKATAAAWLTVRHEQGRIRHEAAQQAAHARVAEQRRLSLATAARPLERYIRSTILSHRCPRCGDHPTQDPLKTLTDPGALAADPPHRDDLATQLSSLTLVEDDAELGGPAAATSATRSVRSAVAWRCEGTGCQAVVCGICGGVRHGGGGAAPSSVGVLRRVMLGRAAEVECDCGVRLAPADAARSSMGCERADGFFDAAAALPGRQAACARRVDRIVADMPQDLAQMIRDNIARM